MPTGRTVHPSTRRHNKTTTTTTMYATSATRCVTRRLKNIFAFDTSRTRRLCDVSLSRDVRRWDGWFDDGTRLRGSSRPRRATRTTSRCPRSSNPAPRRLVSSFPRVGIISIDLIVDASASIARRRTPNAGTLSTDSLILPFFAFSLDAALSPPGRPTVKVRRTRAHFRNASHTIRRKTAHRVRFPRARSRGRGRDSTGGIVDVHRDGWARRRPLSLLMDGWMGVSDVIDGS